MVFTLLAVTAEVVGVRENMIVLPSLLLPC